MVGLVIEQMHLQQSQPVVNPLDQPRLVTSRCTARDPAEAGRLHVAADLVADLAGGQYRWPAGHPKCPARACRPPSAAAVPRSAR